MACRLPQKELGQEDIDQYPPGQCGNRFTNLLHRTVSELRVDGVLGVPHIWIFEVKPVDNGVGEDGENLECR